MPAHDQLADRCRQNLDAIRGRLADACRRAGRSPDDVKLVGVTKYVTADLARVLLDAGCTDLAESRPQLLWSKAESLAGHRPVARWHLVGHLQRNKIRRTLPVLSLLHSLDSLRLLDAIDAEAAAAGVVCDTLIEVNLAGDPARTGVMETEVALLVEQAVRRPHVRLLGLMGMAGLTDIDGTSPRRQFARLRQLRDEVAARVSTATGLHELSMGMSGDFVEAVLEGATLVRIGSALWEGIPAGQGR